jgi:ABC-2 type transport system ATP-binding protein
VAILKTGTLITTGPVSDVLMDEDIVEIGAADIQQLAGMVQNISDKISINEEAGTLQLVLPKGTANLEEINAFCFSRGITLSHLLMKKKRLEARFFELTNDIQQQA